MLHDEARFLGLDALEELVYESLRPLCTWTEPVCLPDGWADGLVWTQRFEAFMIRPSVQANMRFAKIDWHGAIVSFAIVHGLEISYAILIDVLLR